MPDINPFGYEKNFEIQNEITVTTGYTAGLAIHSVLQNIPKWISAEGALNNDLLKNEISRYTKADFEKPFSLASRLLIECKNIASTKLIRSNLDNIYKGKPEFNLILPINGDILNGSIDLLIEKEDSIEIWDWKSNIVNEDNTIEIHAKHYELQMKTYAHFVHKLYPDIENIKARLLFTRLAKENAEDKDWSYEFTWTTDELMLMENELLQLIKGLRNHLYSWL
jgi:ATP-dependent exoDNAse (exonuclease V) beta subunit